eukprot:scaffold3026_cov221-Pinguiococcus_pyrenoidosus.AAC.6
MQGLADYGSDASSETSVDNAGANSAKAAPAAQATAQAAGTEEPAEPTLPEDFVPQELLQRFLPNVKQTKAKSEASKRGDPPAMRLPSREKLGDHVFEEKALANPRLLGITAAELGLADGMALRGDMGDGASIQRHSVPEQA